MQMIANCVIIQSEGPDGSKSPSHNQVQTAGLQCGVLRTLLPRDLKDATTAVVRACQKVCSLLRQVDVLNCFCVALVDVSQITCTESILCVSIQATQ